MEVVRHWAGKGGGVLALAPVAVALLFTRNGTVIARYNGHKKASAGAGAQL